MGFYLIFLFIISRLFQLYIIHLILYAFENMLQMSAFYAVLHLHCVLLLIPS